ncbi:hypothetical protein BH24ACT26_BH24ACT26_17710 [soil metagenome]
MEERRLRALYARLEEVIGDDHATTLMQHLPPTEGSALATHSDVQALGDRLDRRGDLLKHRMDSLDQRMDKLELERHMERFDDRLHDFHGALREQTRTFVAVSIGSMVTVSVVAFGAATLI